MKPKPLPKHLFDKAVALGITRIELNFSGGSDDGYLNVELCPIYGDDKKPISYGDFAEVIEEWAWGEYEYSGAGEGVDYGDDIFYDLKKGKVGASEWGYVRHDGPVFLSPLEIKEEA